MSFGRSNCISWSVLDMYEFLSSKRMSWIFKILFQSGDSNIFVLSVVFFSKYVQLKSSFSDEKISAVKSETL